jgi:lysophospholipase L1-like esterase
MQRLALSVFGLVLAMLVLEVVLRLGAGLPEVTNPLSAFHQSDELVGWIGVPNIRRRFVRRQFDVVVEHGPEGFRRPEPEPPAAPEERVLVLGDSATWGWGVGQGEVFTDWLQRELAPRVAIYNRGVNAFGTAQQLLLLGRELERRHYDKVVVMFTPNDFRDNLDPKSGRRPYFTRDGDELVPRNQPPRPLMSGIKRFFMTHSHAAMWLDYQHAFFKAWQKRLREGASAEDTETAKPTRRDPARPKTIRGSGITARLIAEMQQVARANGAALSVVVPGEPDPGRTTVNTEMIEICRRLHIPVVSVGAALRRDVIFEGDGHWTAEGHRRVAEALLSSPLFASTGSTERVGSRPDAVESRFRESLRPVRRS